MTLNPPKKVRAAIYVSNGLLAIVVAYLNAKGIIGVAEVTAWAAYSLFTSSLAGYNVTK